MDPREGPQVAPLIPDPSPVAAPETSPTMPRHRVRSCREQRGGCRGECNSPVQPIHVGDANHLEEGEKDEIQGGGVAVEDLKPVAPGLQREAGGREEAGQAGRPCTHTTPRGRLPAALPAPRTCSAVCSSPPPPALFPGAGGHWGWPERAVWGQERVSAPCTLTLCSPVTYSGTSSQHRATRTSPERTSSPVGLQPSS